VLECITGFGEAGRMTQFKDKSQKGGADRTNVGLFTYPILQAADILLYQADFVPVGEDQRQHIELTRDLGQRFNSKYKEIFNIPQAQIIKSLAKINDLQDPTAKMSKSASSMSGVIELLDAPEVTLKKFKSSVTDDGKEVKFEEKGKPGISNLLTIHSALSGKSIEAIENEFAGKGYGDFKSAVAEVVIAELEPIRERTKQLMDDPAELVSLLKAGADKANEVASNTLKEAYTAIGLI
jgi:tryptophanyl-tRNA synthetase